MSNIILLLKLFQCWPLKNLSVGSCVLLIYSHNCVCVSVSSLDADYAFLDQTVSVSDAGSFRESHLKAVNLHLPLTGDVVLIIQSRYCPISPLYNYYFLAIQK